MHQKSAKTDMYIGKQYKRTGWSVEQTEKEVIDTIDMANSQSQETSCIFSNINFDIRG